MPDFDDIIIQRIKSKKKGKSTKGRQKVKEPSENGLPRTYDKQFKLLAILLFLFSVLLFLALISYTPRDEANAQISFGDLFGLITGNEAVLAKAETTYNWLGLFGAYLSNVLYNSTIGYSIIFLPYFIALWAKYLFTGRKLSDKLVKGSITYLTLGVLASSVLATMQNISWLFEIPKQWSGAVGDFLYSVTSSLIGTIGAFLLFFTGIIITLILGTDIKIDGFINRLILKYENLTGKAKDYSKDYVKKKIDSRQKNIQSKAPADNTTNIKITSNKTPSSEIKEKPNPSYADNDALRDDSFEPAKFIRKNLDLNIKSRKTAGNYPPQDSPDKDALGTGKPAIQSKYTKDYNNFNSDNTNSDKEADSHNTEFNNQEPEITYNRSDAGNTNDDEISSDSSLKISDKVPASIETEDTAGGEFNVVNELDDFMRHTGIADVPPHKAESANVNDVNVNDVNINDVNINQNESKNNNSDIDKSETNIKIKHNENPAGDIGNIPDDIAEPASGNKKFIVTVNETETEEQTEFNSPLCTVIHDEKINYRPLTISLLGTESEIHEVNDRELKENAKILQEKLETFKIHIENLSVTPGPVVTQYEFVPAAGIKISKIESLSDDLAMALKARGIRIIAPIPGKGTVGIEIPNSNPSLVSFKSVAASASFARSKFMLPLALGKTIAGDVEIADLTKMPHLLIAGSTGSGKSVGINTIIASLLFKKHPSELKFVIIDPKKVELQQYKKLKNHFMAASPDLKDVIITDPMDAVVVLKAAVAEMELRYDILSQVGQRNIGEYNEKVKSGKIKNKDMDHRQMPFIVVVIDELADLMLTASKDIEEPIIRLAQMARAVGIHLILATQRPSVDVITGIIKANFPARAAYLVASRIDSRTILDGQGAEKLLGNGDMLFLPPGRPKPIRLQNSFISTDEVDDICDFIGKQRGYSTPYYLPSLNARKDSSMIDTSHRDPLFEEAAYLIIQHQQGSVSLIQRRLKVGYARAGRIVDELEAAGVVGPFDGSKARIVLMESPMELEAVL